MKNRYTNGHKGFATSLEEDWGKTLDDLMGEIKKENLLKGIIPDEDIDAGV